MKKLLLSIIIAGTAAAQVPPFSQPTEEERIALQNILQESEVAYAKYGASATKANVDGAAYKVLQDKIERMIYQLKISHGATNCGFTPGMQFIDCGKVAPAVPPSPKPVPSPAVPPGPKAKQK